MTETGHPSIAAALIELGQQVGGVDLPVPPREGQARYVDFGSLDDVTPRPLPGEDAPLEPSPGRGPVTEDEALGVARRLARTATAASTTGRTFPVPDELPDPDARTQHAFRLPPYWVALARARAEMEDTTLTAVVEAAIRTYAQGGPGDVVGFMPPRGKRPSRKRASGGA